MLQVEILNDVNENFINDITDIDRKSIPLSWECLDFKEYFCNEKNQGFILKDSGKMVGYLLAGPHNDAKDRLKDDDPEMLEDESRYYIESVAIHPSYRGIKGFNMLKGMLFKALNKQGICKISMHASNKLSGIMRKLVKVTQKRTIDRWPYYNKEESTDYIEADISGGGNG